MNGPLAVSVRKSTGLDTRCSEGSGWAVVGPSEPCVQSLIGSLITKFPSCRNTVDSNSSGPALGRVRLIMGGSIAEGCFLITKTCNSKVLCMCMCMGLPCMVRYSEAEERRVSEGSEGARFTSEGARFTV